MQDKKIKIIYFSIKDSGAREMELTWRKLLTMVSAIFMMLFLMVSVSLAFFTDFYQNLEISSLSKSNSHLRAQLDTMGEKIEKIEDVVASLEQEDDHLRLAADLPRIDEDTRHVGIGGLLDVNYELPIVGSRALDDASGYQNTLETMERRLALTQHSRDEIRSKLEESREIMKHTPSIRPLVGGRISDNFGFRLHPILDKIRRHPGIDIAAERGTEVYATAAGVVEKIVTTYQRNKSWGKYVLIDHGFGHKTLYGHLSKILVRTGQKVDRWNPVGLVGSTGLATGPHLHYEVRRDGKPLDPQSYILN